MCAFLVEMGDGVFFAEPEVSDLIVCAEDFVGVGCGGGVDFTSKLINYVSRVKEKER